MKTSELLTEAKKYLWDGEDEKELERLDKSEYICFAILSAARNSSNERANHEIYFQCRKVIESSLFPHNCVETWLLRSAGIPPKEMTHKRIQAHRLAWMNLLIKEFKAKGD